MKKTERLFVRVDPDLLKRIDRQAKRVRRDRSDYIRMVLELAVEAAEEAEKKYEKKGG